MEEHLYFDEIVDYIYCDTLTLQMAVLAQKVNAHILRCDECKRLYGLIRKLHSMINKRSNIECINNSWKELVTFQMEDKVKLVVDYIKKSFYYFDYPMDMANRGNNDGRGRNQSVLVDEDDSRNVIRCDNGNIDVFLNADEWGQKPLFLGLVDVEGRILQIEKMELKDNVYMAKLLVEDGTYSILIGEI